MAKRVLLLFLLLPSLAGAQAWLGHWQGAAIRDGSVRIFNLQVLQVQGKIWAVVHSPDWGWSDAQELPAEIKGDTLRFTFGGLPVALVEDPEKEEAIGALGEGPQAIRLHFKRVLAPPPALSTRIEVTFKSGAETIAGTLIKPISGRAAPAVVYLPGRGVSQRQGWRMGERFAERGIAVLIFDQRGAGKSTGNEKTATLQDQIEDAIAAVRFLKGRKDIVPSKIGLYTESAGGWIAPFVANRAGVACLMLSVCPAESVEQQQLSTFEIYLRHSPKHLSEEEIQKGMAFVRLMLDHAIRNADRKPLDESFAEVSKARYADEIEATPEGLADNIDWIRRHSIDPAPAWKKVTVPVLALYGGADDIVEASRNTTLLRKYLEEAGNKDVTIQTIPNASHGLRVNGGPRAVAGQSYFSWTRMPPSVPETFLEWCERRFDEPRAKVS